MLGDIDPILFACAVLQTCALLFLSGAKVLRRIKKNDTQTDFDSSALNSICIDLLQQHYGQKQETTSQQTANQEASYEENTQGPEAFRPNETGSEKTSEEKEKLSVTLPPRDVGYDTVF